MIRGVGQRCSFNHNTHQQQRGAGPPSSAASTSSTESGSPPSSVHLGNLDSGYTTPSNLTTNGSVNTQETSASSSSSTASTASAGPTPSASPNTTAQMFGQTSQNTHKSINLLVNVPPKSETIKSAPVAPPSGQMPPHYITMPRNSYMSHQRHPSSALMMSSPSSPGSAAQVAVMSNTGGTLQKVKRIYL
jgi:hypothetical protein